MKCPKWCEKIVNGESRAPQGARGLKCSLIEYECIHRKSRPARGAWVEMRVPLRFPRPKLSRPARGAWVEIGYMLPIMQSIGVAPRKGRVG